MSFGRFREEPASAKNTNSNDTISSPLSGKDAFISKGSKITGNLAFIGPVEIDGQVDGEINAQDRLSIGESAVINAKIVGADITIRGVVNGDVAASRRVTLKKPARVHGSIVSPLLSIEDGVLFEGKVSMPQASQPAISQSSSVQVAVGSGHNDKVTGLKVASTPEALAKR